MLFKKFFILVFLILFSFSATANTPRSTGKYKNWESFTAQTDKGKICFAQTIPTKRAPASIKREKSKLFVTFRPSENIKDEVSLTSGHDYKSSTVMASSGKKRYSFFSQKNSRTESRTRILRDERGIWLKTGRQEHPEGFPAAPISPAILPITAAGDGRLCGACLS